MSLPEPETRSVSKIIVFAGPSLPPEGLESAIDLRPPATRRVLREVVKESSPPRAVVLLDGAFFQQPAPTHYDLLYVLRASIGLIGASSMGALRAAELRNRGMRGIGVVYDAVLSGLVTDDAELAVAMCPFTHRALTVSLVRVRCALHLACRAGLSERDAAIAFDCARRIHFLERNAVGLRRAWQAALPKAAHDLIAWIDRPESDVKAADAREAVRYALASVSSDSGDGFGAWDVNARRTAAPQLWG